MYDRRFLIARPILRALEVSPAVLLVDEIDRADDEFEAFLLEVLADNAVTIPELGTIRPAEPPIVVLTSNRTRELHDALKRRCLYHWVDHPDLEREVEIIRRHQPEVADRLARQVAAGVAAMRAAGLVKPPGIAEAIDWATALRLLGATELSRPAVRATLGALLKYREDQVTAERDVLPDAGSWRRRGTAGLAAARRRCRRGRVRPGRDRGRGARCAAGAPGSTADASRSRSPPSPRSTTSTLLDPAQVYWTTRLTLCSEPDDLPRFDAAFAEWFGPGAAAGPVESTVRRSAAPGESGEGAPGRPSGSPRPRWRPCAPGTSPRSPPPSGPRYAG